MSERPMAFAGREEQDRCALYAEIERLREALHRGVRLINSYEKRGHQIGSLYEWADDVSAALKGDKP